MGGGVKTRCPREAAARRRSVRWDACKTPLSPYPPPPSTEHCSIPALALSAPSQHLNPHHHHSSSSSSSLLQTLGHQPCRDTVIYTLYFYFFPPLPPSSIVTGPTRCAAITDKKKENCQKHLLPPTAATATRHLSLTHPPPPFDPSTPSPASPASIALYHYLHTPNPHPSPPFTPGLYLSACLACLLLPVCSCLPKVRYCSRSVQRQPSLFLSLSLSYTPSIQPLLVNTFLPVLINFFSFPVAHRHAHTQHTQTHTAENWLAMAEDAP